MLQVIKNVLVGITEEGKEEPSSALRYGLSLAATSRGPCHGSRGLPEARHPACLGQQCCGGPHCERELAPSGRRGGHG